MYQSTSDLSKHYRLVLARNFSFSFNDGRGDSFSFCIRFNIENSPYSYAFGGYQIGKQYLKFSKEGRMLYNKLNKLFDIDNIDLNLNQKEMTDPTILWAIFPKDTLSVFNDSAVGFARLGWKWKEDKKAVNYILESEII